MYKIYKQTLLIMRLTILLLLIAMLQVSAKSALAQRISLSVKGAPLQEVMQQIRQQSEYAFIFNISLLKSAKPVSVSLTDVSVEEAIQAIFKNQPFNWELSGKSIIVKAAGAYDHQPANPPQYTPLQQLITGRIVDANGQSIAGVTLRVTGAKQITTTNGMGRFSLTGVEEGATLEVSAVGFAAMKLTLENNTFVITTDQTNVDAAEQPLLLNPSPAALLIKLAKRVSPLDEVQVIAYGTTSKRLTTSNISTVSSETLAKQPVANPLLALQGQIPGIRISPANGAPNAGITVRIQGQNSILNGNDPFYVVDGVPYPSQLLATGLNNLNLGNSGATPGNPLSFISTDDIERIDVLKDADATAIYGSRAANGAILITTKKGKAGSSKVDLSLQSGFSAVTNTVDMLNTAQYLEMRREALKNTNTAPTAANAYDILGLYGYDNDLDKNWQKEMLSKKSNFSNYQLNFSGGNPNTQFLIGGGYIGQGTFLPGDFKDRKASARFSISHTSNDQRFRIEMGGNYMDDKNTLQGSNNFVAGSIPALSPNAPSLYNPDGSLNFALDDDGFTTFVYGNNPLATLKNVYINNSRNLVAHGNLSYRVFKGFDIKIDMGYNTLTSKEIITTPLSSFEPYYRPYILRSTQFADNSIGNWIVEPQLTYSLQKKWGEMNFLLGATAQQSNNDGQGVTASGYTSDDMMLTLAGATTLTRSGVLNSVYKYSALFSRFNYTYQNKYLLNVTFRRDGTSRFSPDYRFHTFGAVGAGWIFTEEKFMNGVLPILNFGKINASYGNTGSDQIGDYQYFATYGSGGYPYQNIAVLSLSKIANPDLHWEETRKFNLGLQTRWFKDRIVLEANYANNRSSDQLLSYLVPFYASGFGSVSSNFPALVQNTSLEFTFSSHNIRSRQWQWTTTFNFTLPKNKLLSFPNLASSSYANALVIGEAVNRSRLYHMLGVDPATGQYVFSDSRGNPTFNPDPNADFVYVDTNPKYYGGLGNTLSYKGISLDFLLQFMKKMGRNEYFPNGLVGSLANNFPAYVTNRWQNPGDIAGRMLYTTNSSTSYNNARLSSDGAYTDASYIKLRNISLTWTLPQNWIEKAKLKNASIFILGQNMLTISPYYGGDPEISTSSSYPASLTLTFGLRASL